MTLSRLNRGRGGHRGASRAVGALTVAGLAAAALVINCDDNETTTASVAAVDVFPYDYYYASDVSVGDAYWADSWDVDPFYFVDVQPFGQTYGGGSGGSTGTGSGGSSGGGSAGISPSDGGIIAGAFAGPGAVLRELARGANLCPGQVTVAQKTATACSFSGGPGSVRGGATLTFNGCILSGGGRLDGVIDVTSTPVPSDTNCDANTTINVSYTSTFTNFSYTAPDGSRVVIPSLTNMGSYSRKVTFGPTALAVSSNGTLQRYDASGALTADHGLNGARNFTIANNGAGVTFKVNGALAVQDHAIAGGLLTVTGTGVTRTNACCRPTDGTIVVTGTGRDTDTWVFGPACGAATLNGRSVSLPACQ